VTRCWPRDWSGSYERAHKLPTWGEEAQGLASRYAIASGVAVTFVLFGLIVIPSLLRERRPPATPPSDQPAAASVGWLDQAEAPPSKGKDLPPVDPATVMTANPKLLARGEVLFKQNCTSCHGDAGRGDGPAAATLNPKPRNFTQPASGRAAIASPTSSPPSPPA
jgi:mono/diheme cytochrome c family protein